MRRSAVNILQIITTTASVEDARRIAEALVERRLAACVQIFGPIESIYRWEGKIENATEFQCWIKTREELYPRVELAIRELHTYDVPEVLALPVVQGSSAYLDWLARETA
jgi:periplasmic divalent cation tolerance protein